jgi:hypothetical protein
LSKEIWVSTETDDDCSHVGAADVRPARRWLFAVIVNALVFTGIHTREDLKHGRPFADSFTSALIASAASAAMAYVCLRVWEEWRHAEDRSELLARAVTRLVVVVAAFFVLMVVRDWLLGVP